MPGKICILVWQVCAPSSAKKWLQYASVHCCSFGCSRSCYDWCAFLITMGCLISSSSGCIIDDIFDQFIETVDRDQLVVSSTHQHPVVASVTGVLVPHGVTCWERDGLLYHDVAICGQSGTKFGQWFWGQVDVYWVEFDSALGSTVPRSKQVSEKCWFCRPPPGRNPSWNIPANELIWVPWNLPPRTWPVHRNCWSWPVGRVLHAPTSCSSLCHWGSCATWRHMLRKGWFVVPWCGHLRTVWHQIRTMILRSGRCILSWIWQCSWIYGPKEQTSIRKVLVLSPSTRS